MYAKFQAVMASKRPKSSLFDKYCSLAILTSSQDHLYQNKTELTTCVKIARHTKPKFPHVITAFPLVFWTKNSTTKA